VLQTALEIVDRDGVEGLSMRRLGHRLDRDPMSLYRYAASKKVLLDGVAELVLGRLTAQASNRACACESARTAETEWEYRLRSMARDIRRLLLAHPNVALLVVTRPLQTPLAQWPRGAQRQVEATLEVLSRAGFPGSDALRVVRAFAGFLNGHLLVELQDRLEDPDETDDLHLLGLQRLPLQAFPHLRGLAADLVAYDGATELERGLDLLFDGLRAQRPPTID